MVVIVTNTASAGNLGQAFLKALGMLVFILFCPRRVAENGNCNGNFFFPRRATKDREERQRQHLLSTEDTEGHGERQLQLLFSTKGREGPRRTATATPFVHRGHGGPRRTATATSFFHEGPRRAAKNCNCNTFCPQRTRRATENGNFFFPRRATKDREELQRQHLLFTEDTEGHGERQLQRQLLSDPLRVRRTTFGACASSLEALGLMRWGCGWGGRMATTMAYGGGGIGVVGWLLVLRQSCWIWEETLARHLVYQRPNLTQVRKLSAFMALKTCFW